MVDYTRASVRVPRQAIFALVRHSAIGGLVGLTWSLSGRVLPVVVHLTIGIVLLGASIGAVLYMAYDVRRMEKVRQRMERESRLMLDTLQAELHGITNVRGTFGGPFLQ